MYNEKCPFKNSNNSTCGKRLETPFFTCSKAWGQAQTTPPTLHKNTFKSPPNCAVEGHQEIDPRSQSSIAT